MVPLISRKWSKNRTDEWYHWLLRYFQVALSCYQCCQLNVFDWQNYFLVNWTRFSWKTETFWSPLKYLFEITNDQDISEFVIKYPKLATLQVFEVVNQLAWQLVYFRFIEIFPSNLDKFRPLKSAHIWYSSFYFWKYLPEMQLKFS